MTTEERIKDRRIGVIGMARSGVQAALLAKRLGGRPFVSDSQDESGLGEYAACLRAESIPYETGGHTDQLLASDYLVISPGVPLEIEIVARARGKGLPIFSEIEFASWVCAGRIVAVTGSNGKTTTTSLLGSILTNAGFNTYVCGNIGLPFAEAAHEVTEDSIAVVEVSNFQLETIADFHPNVALILNLTPDHLDRHGSFAEYKKAKYRLTENQTAADTLILNQNDQEIMADDIYTRAEKVFFSTSPKGSAGTFVEAGHLFAIHNQREIEIIKCDEIKIAGPHNLQNAAAAVCAALCFDVSRDVIADTLRSFPGVEHRLEEVGRVAGVNFINDSKATNVGSVCCALQSVDTGLYLIAGGRGKGASYKPIIEHGRDKIRGIFVIGEARERIFDDLGQSFPVEFVDSLQGAVEQAFAVAHPGETVLLSPGCASFDMFENFEQRGITFKDAVASLKNGKNKNENEKITS